MWFVANCDSIPSSVSWKGQNITPALFLKFHRQTQINIKNLEILFNAKEQTQN